MPGGVLVDRSVRSGVRYVPVDLRYPASLVEQMVDSGVPDTADIRGLLTHTLCG
ncbi:hypothetical protein [Nocardia sienata]|uniref:hypothetical protein n=1 Tax=Nocardia sienata TaxID=248552 RepID=UPI000AC873BC|nr:hypothetical protein [Nocardia sienata]